MPLFFFDLTVCQPKSLALVAFTVLAGCIELTQHFIFEMNVFSG